MEAIGFFRELRHGLPNGPLLKDAVSDPLPEGDREAIARYLLACPVIYASGTRAVDALHPESGEVSGVHLHSDGTYVWPEDAAYYVRRYGARLPLGFLRHVADVPSIPTDEDLDLDEVEVQIGDAMAAQR